MLIFAQFYKILHDSNGRFRTDKFRKCYPHVISQSDSSLENKVSLTVTFLSDESGEATKKIWLKHSTFPKAIDKRPDRSRPDEITFYYEQTYNQMDRQKRWTLSIIENQFNLKYSKLTNAFDDDHWFEIIYEIQFLNGYPKKGLIYKAHNTWYKDLNKPVADMGSEEIKSVCEKFSAILEPFIVDLQERLRDIPKLNQLFKPKNPLSHLRVDKTLSPFNTAGTTEVKMP